MIWFYKRLNKDSKKSIIVCNTWMFYFRNITAIIGVIACLLNQILIATISLIILAFLLVRFLVKEDDIIKEIKLQSNENYPKISYLGSKYSFKNPLTIIINQ